MAAGTINLDRSAMRALRRLAVRFVSRAARPLASPNPSDQAVHGARKDLKRARTGLRLLRPALGERIYRRENVVLRDAAHTLNRARDAKTLVETLQSLRRSSRSLRAAPGVAELLGALQAEHASAQRRLEGHPAELTRMREELRQLCGRADEWRTGNHGWSVLGPALKRMYRRGRRALPKTGQRASDASLHEWRKQVKYVRYALEMLKSARSGKLARRAEQLTDTLGDAHDLTVLARKARGFAKRNRIDLEVLLVVTERRRNRLAADSLRSGEEFFGDKPRDWERYLSGHSHR